MKDIKKLSTWGEQIDLAELRAVIGTHRNEDSSDATDAIVLQIMNALKLATSELRRVAITVPMAQEEQKKVSRVMGEILMLVEIEK